MNDGVGEMLLKTRSSSVAPLWACCRPAVCPAHTRTSPVTLQHAAPLVGDALRLEDRCGGRLGGARVRVVVAGVCVKTLGGQGAQCSLELGRD